MRRCLLSATAALVVITSSFVAGAGESLPARHETLAPAEFSSDMPLSVVVHLPGRDLWDRLRTPTPDGRPVRIPACREWWVEAVDDEPSPEQTTKLVLEARRSGARGVRIELREPLDQATADALVEATAIETLILGGSGVDDALLARLPRMESLRSITLQSRSPCRVTGKGLAQLRSLPKLRHVRLTGLPLRDDEVAAVLANPSVVEVEILVAPTSGAAVAGLAERTGMRSLDLGHTRTADRDVLRLAGLSGLEVLLLGGTSITDAALGVLAGMPRLRDLSLWDVAVTDAGIARIASLHMLESLNLGRTAVTDAGLAAVAGLEGLEVLYLWSTAIGDPGVAHLASLRSLRTLALGSTRVTDACLEVVARLPAIEDLDLSDTVVTDAGIGCLANAKTLKRVKLERTEVTSEAVEALRAAIPGIEVEWGDPPPSLCPAKRLP